ncbi:hypothetical protein [Photobacterium chitinilyticum]|uniref:Uncharacterized protein n=1 Tax=Photobacterium chitinilyticum TaxID=2485123 RepID=A0A3S3QP33_9GAMM|nr:hypothetical protein [Photobacterium chitinilyticum]RWX54973.1 hypothetical protein EDI28_14640 [Photobacterium chitinilyticum]
MEDFGFGWFAFGWFIAVLIGWSGGRAEKVTAPKPSEFSSAIVYAWAIVGVMCWIMGAIHAPN